ncbi:MAG: lipid-binding SYLF domain-containing protein [Rhodospirillales bacterium]
MKRTISFFASGLTVFVLASCADIKSDPATLPQDLVNRAVATVERFKTTPELSAFNELVGEARAVVVLPTVLKAGFIGAGEAGHGLLLVRTAGNSPGNPWSQPAFYTMGGASFGLQAGIQEGEIVLIIRSEKALQAVLSHQLKLGGDVGITVGMLGAGAEASTTTNLGADIIAVSYSVLGVFGGISLEGSVLARRNDFNEAYYGAGATPRSIVIEGRFANPGTDKLRSALAGI